MAIFAMSDVHLSLSIPDKSMSVFGPSWENYIERIREGWTSVVGEDDTVLVSGDISWATKISEADKDFEFLASLPGRKLLSRGNHDYWWTTISKMDSYFAERDYGNIEIVRTNVVEAEGCLISGTRGWMMPNDNDFKEQDRKIYDRELERLRLCFTEMDKADPGRTMKRIIMLHYPPITRFEHPTDFTELIKAGGADICVYGHLHGRAHDKVYREEVFEKCKYLCTASDYLRFKPVRIV